MARGEQRTMLDRICAAYDAIRGTSDLVVLQGINYRRSLSIFDMDINAAIAARLDAPVVLVAGASVDGCPVPAGELTASVLSAWSSFRGNGCDLIGVVVNRVVQDTPETAWGEYVEALESENVAVFGVLPNLDYLGLPRLAQIAEALDADVISGGEFLGNIPTQTLVAAMEPRNFVKWLQSENTLIVAPGDRDDIMMAVALAQRSARHCRICGLLLTGDLRPDPAILELVKENTGREFPILSVRGDTYNAVAAVRALRVRIGPDDDEKIFAATAAVERYVDQNRLWDTLEVSPTRPAGAGSFLDSIVSRARQHCRTIAFPEGQEPRTIRAVARLARDRVVQPVLLGNADQINAAAAAEDLSLEGVQIIDPRASSQRERYGQAVYEIRRHKRGSMTRETALQWIDQSPIHYATVMVQCDDAHGLVAGAIHATGDTIRPAFQIIGVRSEVGIASSVFLMVFKDRVLIYGDCAIVPSPNAQELASIALSAARTARTFGIDPRVAMLSYSTGKSGAGSEVDKVAEATRIVRQREPLLAVDGPMQYDAAIDADVGRSKQPDSPVAGQATVFIFPDLDAGNIAYKAVQRMSGASAVGPIMQGMNKPVNDLSRGCSADDIYYVAAITAVQADGARCGPRLPAGSDDVDTSCTPPEKVFALTT